MYEQMLADIDGPVLKQAVLSLIASAKFFPKIAEIREAAIALIEPAYPSALVAWEMVTSGDKSCPLANQAMRALGVERGDLRYMDFATVSVNKSLFIKEFQLRVEQQRAEVRMLPAVRALCQQALTYAGQAHTEHEHPSVRSGSGPHKIEDLLGKEIK